MPILAYENLKWEILKMRQRQNGRSKYFHFRVKGKNGEKYSPYGGATVCALSMNDTDKVALGVSVCLPMDPFVYSVGREYAYSHALKSIHRYQAPKEKIEKFISKPIILKQMDFDKLRQRSKKIVQQVVEEVMERYYYKLNLYAEKIKMMAAEDRKKMLLLQYCPSKKKTTSIIKEKKGK